MSEQTRIKSTLYISNLSMDVTPPVLESAFIPFGDILSVSLPKPDLASNQDPHRGFGYVEFESDEDAHEALNNMDQSELFGRVIKVAQAKPQKREGEGLGSRTAVWEQEGYLARHGDGGGEEGAEAEGIDGGEGDSGGGGLDPMQGLEGLDVAGPKRA